MNDYQSLDLASVCNVGVDFLNPEMEPLLGRQSLYGLPFLVGGESPDRERCFVGFGGAGAGGAVNVPIGAAARHVIVAHALIESQILAGEPVGRVVAHYIFHYADGQQERVPIRDRFEVAVVPTTWGQFPFVALPDQKPGLMPRYSGEWGQSGARLTEAHQGWPRCYYLWAWRNPRPDTPIESLTIEPADRRFIVAALTLGHADEEPFARGPKREVAIALSQSEDATRPFGLEVEVDRGVATYPYALPSRPAGEFLADSFKGWGEAQNESASPAFVEVAATPSATLTLRNQGEELGQVNWGELQRQGAIETPRARLELIDRGRNWVRVNVLDDATGRPIPCRIHFRSPEGVPYQPHGHHNYVTSNLDSWHIDVGGDVRLGQITYAYIDGTCEGWLPRGEVIVDVARGFEYEPLRAAVRIEPGQQELTLQLRRWTDMNAARWFSGDSHVHFLGTQGAQFEARSEDLNVVNLLQSQWGHLFTNTEDFSGEPAVSRDGRTIVYCSQENRQHILGHLILWGLTRPVSPWCTDGPSEAELGGTLEETMAAWADACRAQGGTVVIPHLPNPNGEPAALIATGRADAVEMLTHGDYQHLEYYRYLNGGYRLPLVGGTDKMSSDVPVGLYRTYAYIPDDQEFSYANWCRAVREGRTFLSGGPILRFSVEGARIGDTLRLPGPGSVEVEAEVESIFPIHTLQIVQQGRVVAATEESGGARRLRLRANLKVDGHTWIAARCGGPGYTAVAHHDGWQRGVFAHTSPIYVAVGEEWRLFDLGSAQYMLTLVEGSLAYIRQRAPLHRHGSVTHHHGEGDHLAYLERPFHEAYAAIRRRIEEER